jgi:hypothetical protein
VGLKSWQVALPNMWFWANFTFPSIAATRWYEEEFSPVRLALLTLHFHAASLKAWVKSANRGNPK